MREAIILTIVIATACVAECIPLLLTGTVATAIVALGGNG